MRIIGIFFLAVVLMATLSVLIHFARAYWGRPKGLQHADVPWWQFWRPGSGLIGGLIFGFVLAAVVMVVLNG